MSNCDEILKTKYAISSSGHIGTHIVVRDKQMLSIDFFVDIPTTKSSYWSSGQ